MTHLGTHPSSTPSRPASARAHLCGPSGVSAGDEPPAADLFMSAAGLIAAALVALFAASALALMWGSPALVSSQAPAVSRAADGGISVDSAALELYYYGRRLSVVELIELNRQGRALVGVNNIELACHGLTLHVDTPAEAAAYSSGFEGRQRTVLAQPGASGASAPSRAQPCASWRAPLVLPTAPPR